MTWLEPWFDDPRFLEANAQRSSRRRAARAAPGPPTCPILFTAHSIPTRWRTSRPTSPT